MLIKLSKFGILLFLVLSISACASSQFYHKNFMRGQVVKVDGNKAVLCIGSEGVSVKGQTLNVYRANYYKPGTDKGFDAFRREYVGELIVDSIIDEHFAKATLNEGDIRERDIVEFKR